MFGIKEKKRIVELEEKKRQLEEENATLQDRILETREDTAWCDETWKNSFNEIGYADLRGGSYGAVKNLSDFEKWEQTSFWKHRKELNRKGSTLLNFRWDDDIIKELFLSKHRPEYKFFICAYCDMILPTPNGPIIHVMDPYGEYIFPPSKSITNNEANSLVGYIVKFNCVMKYGQNEYEILGYEKLPYTLYEKQEMCAV